jgi:small subunit ribosomal protein S21
MSAAQGGADGARFRRNYRSGPQRTLAGIRQRHAADLSRTVGCARHSIDECSNPDPAAIAEQLVARSQGSHFGTCRTSPINTIMVGAYREGTRRSPFGALSAGLEGCRAGAHCSAQRSRKELPLQVIVRENNVEQALRALKKKLQREGVFREMKRRRAYEKPSEKRAREKSEAVRRARKLARKQAQREGLIAKPAAKRPAFGRR